MAGSALFFVMKLDHPARDTGLIQRRLASCCALRSVNCDVFFAFVVAVEALQVSALPRRAVQHDRCVFARLHLLFKSRSVIGKVVIADRAVPIYGIERLHPSQIIFIQITVIETAILLQRYADEIPKTSPSEPVPSPMELNPRIRAGNCF